MVLTQSNYRYINFAQTQRWVPPESRKIGTLHVRRLPDHGVETFQHSVITASTPSICIRCTSSRFCHVCKILMNIPHHHHFERLGRNTSNMMNLVHNWPLRSNAAAFVQAELERQRKVQYAPPPRIFGVKSTETVKNKANFRCAVDGSHAYRPVSRSSVPVLYCTVLCSVIISCTCQKSVQVEDSTIPQHISYCCVTCPNDTGQIMSFWVQ